MPSSSGTGHAWSAGLKRGVCNITQCFFSSLRQSGLSLRRMKSCSALAWNPLKGMHIVGACDHHLSPTLLRWDLQQANSPFELLGHEQVQPSHEALLASH